MKARYQIDLIIPYKLVYKSLDERQGLVETDIDLL